jgi:3',5'-cyclic AMP phosphodiesterase CpdA
LLIAQITDSHIGFDRGNPDEYNLRRLQAILDRLAAGPNRPDLLLLTGDITEFGDAESYARIAEVTRACPFPVWPMVGNHDEREPLLAGFPQVRPMAEGFVQYALDLGELRLLLLDTLEPGRHGGAFCEARAAWLETRLVEQPDIPTVIAMHHPPFQSGIAWLDADTREGWISRFARTIAGHGQVKAILSGHLHRTIHTLWNGVALTVCGSSAPTVGLDLNPIDPDRPDGRAMIVDEPPSYGLHRWDGTRVISHFEAVGPFQALARYDEGMQQVVRLIEDERSE